MNKNLKPQIIQLSGEGLSYSEISERLNCSKGTISYHLGGNQSKANTRNLNNRKTTGSLSNKISRFHSIEAAEKHKLYTKVNRFHSETGKNYKGLSKERTFTPKDLVEKYKNICYLTGREVNLNDSSSYELDHKIPKYKGGTSTFENCGLTCRDANRAKADMSLEEFFQICVDVVKYNKLT